MENNMPNESIKIELDIAPTETRRNSPPPPSPQSRIVSIQSKPLISPEDGRIGSDTARITAAALYFLDVLIISYAFFTKEAKEDLFIPIMGSILVIYLLISILLFRGGEFIQKIILVISYLRIGVHSVLLIIGLTHPSHATFSSFMALASSIGLVILLSGKSLSKPVYILSTLGVAISSFF